MRAGDYYLGGAWIVAGFRAYQDMPPDVRTDFVNKVRQGEGIPPDMYKEYFRVDALKEYRPSPPNWWLLWVLNVIGVLILVAGIVGEGLAIWALYAKPLSQAIGLTVLILLFVLLVAVAAAPVLRVGALFRSSAETILPHLTTGEASQLPSDDSEESPE
jgi:hypothetical protein